MCNGKTKFQHTASGKRRLPPIDILLSHPPNLAITYEFLTISRINYLHARTKNSFRVRILNYSFFSLHKLRMYEKVKKYRLFSVQFRLDFSLLELGRCHLLVFAIKCGRAAA